MERISLLKMTVSTRGKRIAFALLPLVGVLLLGWDARNIITYYWAANAAILFTQPVFILLGARKRRDPANWGPPTPEVAAGGTTPIKSLAVTERTGSLAGLVFSIVFFCFHFGMFTFVHLIFLLVLGMADASVLLPAILLQVVRRVLLDRETEITRSAASPFPGHVYGNIAALHATIIFGTIISLFLGIRTSLTGALLLCGIGGLVELWGVRVRAGAVPAPNTPGRVG